MGSPRSLFSSLPCLVFLLALSILHGHAEGQLLEATSRRKLPPRTAAGTNVTGGLKKNVTRRHEVEVVGEEGDGSVDVVSQPQLTGDRLRAELWGCKVMCRDERWEPVCHLGGTFANDCWSACSDSVFSHEKMETENKVVASTFSASPPSTNVTRDARGGTKSNHSTAVSDTTTINATRSRAVATVPGMCDPSNERFQPDDYGCVHHCVSVSGGDVGGGGQFARWRPVCGENGVTYTTACFAACSGVRFAEGECHDTSPLTLRRRRR